MNRNTSNPPLENGGFFVCRAGSDPRRTIMVNGRAYRREMNRKEPTVSLPAAITSGIVLGCFVVGVLLLAAGLS